MKKVIFFSAAVIAIILILSRSYLFCATDYLKYLESGISDLNDDYDSNKAIKKFKRIIKASLADEDLKVRAFFWTAYAYQFDDQLEEARNTFKEMFEFINDIEYPFEEGLDKELLQNSDLMRTFENQAKLYFKQVYEGKSKARLIDLEIDKSKEPEKKYLPRLMILGGVIIIALIVAFI
ncbi:MAG: hypothetical protein ABII27_01795 [bacterium]